MDPTLRQLLLGMFQLSQENDQLRARVAELEQRLQAALAEPATGPPPETG